MKILSTVILIVYFLISSSGCSKPIIEGEIVDDLGDPVISAEIKIKNSSISSMTDQNGKYSIDYVPGTIELLASKDGYVSKGLTFNITEKSRYPATQIVLPKIPIITLTNPKGLSETIMGKWFSIKGNTDRPADVLFMGKKISLEKNNSFNLKVSLAFGENKFYLEASPLSHKESNKVTVIVNREAFPAEKEFYKAQNYTIIHRGGLDDFVINENFLITVEGHYKPTLYNLKNNTQIKRLEKLPRDSGYDQAVTFTPDEKYLLVGNYYNHIIGIYDTTNWNLIKSVSTKGGGDFAVCKDKDRSMIITSSNGIWLLDNKKFTISGFFQPSWSINNLTISPHCKYIAVGAIKLIDALRPYDISKMKGVFSGKAWDNMEKKISKRNNISKSYVTAITFSNSDDELIAGTSKGEIVISKVEQYLSLVKKKTINTGEEIKSVTLTKDGKTLLVGSKEKILIYDYPLLKFKIAINTGAEKILPSRNNNSFYFSNKDYVNKLMLDLNWSLIGEYYNLKEKGII